MTKPKQPVAKPGLHPRNPHRAGYDFDLLLAVSPELAPFVRPNPAGTPTIDFADPAAVRALNRALLLQGYRLRDWSLPEGYLCPPIPGRADYLHHLADLLAGEGEVPTGAGVRVLDVGIGANAIYPLIGHQAYGWRFVGSDISQDALDQARRNIAANGLEAAIECRLQQKPDQIFFGVVRPGERYALSLCNPPFHESAEAAAAGAQRKRKNLGQTRPVQNFGGQSQELWCEGGERAFVGRMISESVRMPEACHWFTALISKQTHIPALVNRLHQARAHDIRTIPMSQGQKSSRILAWSFSKTPFKPTV